MDADEATRIRQGASADTCPDILRELATDPSVTVRASLALNPALPAKVSAMLATDTDARVRSILSRKLASLTPNLTEQARKRVQKDAVASLTAMVADAALRMRSNIAEAVKDMPDGPRDIILRLAHDPSVMVCEPVIRFSPMLITEDLVTLIASGPPPSTIEAVARRRKIDTTVSDAIVGTANVAAIAALLANHTAQIREATLDALAAQSEEHTAWQEPLVHRPHLPPRAQRMLSEIVTGHLLEVLSSRADLDPGAQRTLRAALMSIRPRVAGDQPATIDEPGEQAAQVPALHQAGKLDDHAMVDALRRNATMAANTMLALKANVPKSVVERACGLRNAKAVVSLAWKAGFSPQTAVMLQAKLAGLSPDLILRPGESGDFPLSAEEMRWQLTFLGVGKEESRVWTPRRLA